MAETKVKYYQLEPAAFLSDEDFQLMDATERGIYCTVIFYMMCNNGRIRNEPNRIKKMCNVNSDFEQKWDRVRSKFYQKSVWLRHRRVDLELKKAKIRLQRATDKGVRGANARWHRHSHSQENDMAKGSEAKVNKVNNTNTRDSLSFNSRSLRLRQAIALVLPPKTDTDRKAYDNLSRWAVQQDKEIDKHILDLANKARNSKARKPIALFFSNLKKKLGYKSGEQA